MTDIVERLRGRACPAGESWTGEHPEQDHGHTTCWTLHQAAAEIERLRAENAGLRAVNERLDEEITDAILLRERLAAAEAVCEGVIDQVRWQGDASLYHKVAPAFAHWREVAGR